MTVPSASLLKRCPPLCLLSPCLSPCQFNDQLISPKHFVHLAGKSTLKDWKRAIRLGGIMLRYVTCLPPCPASGLPRCSCRIPSRHFVCLAVPRRSPGGSPYLASSTCGAEILVDRAGFLILYRNGLTWGSWCLVEVERGWSPAGDACVKLGLGLCVPFESSTDVLCKECRWVPLPLSFPRPQCSHVYPSLSSPVQHLS